MPIRLNIRHDPTYGLMLYDENSGQIVENCENFRVYITAGNPGIIEISGTFHAVNRTNDNDEKVRDIHRL